MSGAKYGQNFLVNNNVAEKIVRSFLPADGPIIEVGPGKGVLTELLLKSTETNSITAVEIDMGLFYKLKERWADNPRFNVVNRNILQVDPMLLFPNSAGVNLISNVPYYISHDFMDWVIRRANAVKKGVLMLQKEFVDKMFAQPNTKTYNAQTVIFNYIYNTRKCFDVSPGSFSPQPKVKSTVFQFERRNPEALGTDNHTEVEVEKYYQFLIRSFGQRRKTLFNNLQDQNQEALWDVCEARGIDHRVRAEQLTPDDFLAIFTRLFPKRPSAQT